MPRSFVRLEAEHVVEVRPQLQQSPSLAVVEVGRGPRVGQQVRGNRQRSPVGKLHRNRGGLWGFLGFASAVVPAGSSVEADGRPVQRNSKLVRLRHSRGDPVQRRRRVELGSDERQAGRLGRIGRSLHSNFAAAPGCQGRLLRVYDRKATFSCLLLKLQNIRWHKLVLMTNQPLSFATATNQIPPCGLFKYCGHCNSQQLRRPGFVRSNPAGVLKFIILPFILM